MLQAVFTDTNISQGSVATRLKGGGISNGIARIYC